MAAKQLLFHDQAWGKILNGVNTLADAVKGADVFIGLSVGGVVKPEMVASMARNPIVFAMANPDPEIGYEEATDYFERTLANGHRRHKPKNGKKKKSSKK